MPSEITMPQLSDTMSEGTLVKWLKKEGDKVKAGDEIAEVETDKATMPMEAFESGTIAVISVKEGQKVQVGERLAVIAISGEKVEDVRNQFAGGAIAAAATSSANASAARSPARQAPAANDEASPRENPRVHRQVDGASLSDTEIGHGPLHVGHDQSRRESVMEPREHTSEQLSQEATELINRNRRVSERRSAERRSRRNGANSAVSAGGNGGGGATAVEGNGGGDRNGGRIRVSPLARRIAADQGIDLSLVHGSGPAGRIVRSDVLAFAENPPATAARTEAAPSAKPAPPPKSAPSRVSAGEKQVVPLSKMRSVIAARLQQSKQTVPHFYETIDVDVEQLFQLREKVNEQLERENVRLSIGDFVAKAVASALVRHAALNATFDGTQITRYGDVNLGIAVALSEGLIVPVLRRTQAMGLREIRTRSADLVERARAQRLRVDELSGATFSVSNLGTYGIREFSAIINPPEVGILAVAAAEKRAVVRGDAIVVRTMMSLTLSADHRAVDGATAADFLRTLKHLLEEPAMMLV